MQNKNIVIQRGSLSIIFALHKFYQYLYGKKFVLVSDYHPLLSLFNPSKATPTLAVNCLARWTLRLSHYNYIIEYRKTSQHGNAEVLSKLSNGLDVKFDEDKMGADYNTVCTIKTISRQIG